MALLIAYNSRNALLRGMGYQTYTHYLRSQLWKSIRGKKLARDKTCYACGRTARQVHHSEYSFANLSGQSERGLYSVCKGCHRRAEFTRTGRKRTPVQATDMLRRWRRLRIKRRRVPHRPIPDKPGVFRRTVAADIVRQAKAAS
jgi:hypothetical protein